MSRSTIKEQILEIESAACEYPEYSDVLDLQKGILEILIPVSDSPTKGARAVLSDEALENLMEKAKSSKKSLSTFLHASFFHEETISNLAGGIAERLAPRHPKGNVLEGLLKALELGDVDAQEAIKAILEEDSAWFQHLSSIFDIKASLLLFIFDTPLRPFFEELARRVEKEFIETWWEPFCPVCGRLPVVARVRKGKRYMTCTYCGAEYLVDQFLCTNCRNNDPYTLGFIALEDHPEYELSYCEKCNHYIKVLYEERLKRVVPRGLEDLLTSELDSFAEEQDIGLVRA